MKKEVLIGEVDKTLVEILAIAEARGNVREGLFPKEDEGMNGYDKIARRVERYYILMGGMDKNGGWSENGYGEMLGAYHSELL